MPALAAAPARRRIREIGRGVQPLVKAGNRDQIERCESGSHRHRVAGQCARLVNRAERSEPLHDVAAAAERAHRHAAADDLAERREIRAYAVQLLRAAKGHPKTGHDFIEDQQRAAVVALGAQSLEKTRDRRYAVHIAGDGFDDDAGDLSRRSAGTPRAPDPHRCNRGSPCGPRGISARRARWARRM